MKFLAPVEQLCLRTPLIKLCEVVHYLVIELSKHLFICISSFHHGCVCVCFLISLKWLGKQHIKNKHVKDLSMQWWCWLSKCYFFKRQNSLKASFSLFFLNLLKWIFFKKTLTKQNLLTSILNYSDKFTVIIKISAENVVFQEIC